MVGWIFALYDDFTVLLGLTIVKLMDFFVRREIAILAVPRVRQYGNYDVFTEKGAILHLPS